MEINRLQSQKFLHILTSFQYKKLPKNAKKKHPVAYNSISRCLKVRSVENILGYSNSSLEKIFEIVQDNKKILLTTRNVKPLCNKILILHCGEDIYLFGDIWQLYMAWFKLNSTFQGERKSTVSTRVKVDMLCCK